MITRNVTFDVEEDTCEATLWLPNTTEAHKPPVVVMAHGLGATRDMRLDAYAERFCRAGYSCLVFDYRHFGTSTGLPRQLVSPPRQLEDWAAAIEYARTLDEVDGARVIAWGTSFGGGHVIATAATRPPGLVAAIAQCPFTDGIASSLAINPRTSIPVTFAAVGDLLNELVGRAPHRVPVVGPPHTTALMTAPDAETGFDALIPPGSTFHEQIPARAGLSILRYRPGRLTHRIEVPVMFAICENDTVAPAAPTIRYAARAPQGHTVIYPFGHFDIYQGEPFEITIRDQIGFLSRHAPPSGRLN